MEPLAHDPDAVLWANARAMTFRLLGDAQLAERAAADAVAQVRELATDGPGSWAADPRWMTVLAVMAVDRALVLDVVGGADHPELAPRRKELRRRLALVEPAQWPAPVVHHLAGYPLQDTAALLGRDLEDVRADAALFDGSVDYRELGQAQTAARPWPVGTAGGSPEDRDGDGPGSETHTRGRPRGRRPRSLSGTLVVLVLAVVGAGITVTTLFPGQRASTAGPPLSEQRRRVAADVPPMPSPGCKEPPAESGVSAPTVEVAGRRRPYRLATPAADAPVGGSAAPLPLLLGVPAGGQSAAAFASATRLEDATEVLVATVEPVPPFRAVNVEADTRRPDDIAYSLAVVESVAATRCVDLRRVHVVGSGLGARLGGALACVRPATFASVVAVGDGFLPQPCLLDPPVSYLGVPTAPAAPSSPAGTVRVTSDPVAGAWAAQVGATKGPQSRTVGGEPPAGVRTTWTGGRWGSLVESLSLTPGTSPWSPAARAVLDDFVRRTARAD